MKLIGCNNTEHDQGDRVDGDERTVSPNEVVNDSIYTVARAVEVACGSCIYKMPGVSDCKLAAKIDGKAVLVTGSELDAHEHGLCSAAKRATVKGVLEGEEFVATKVTLERSDR